jgi:arsenate reductase (thioredoxin)
MDDAKPLNVLFLCTHNSARSILAEALLNHMGRGKFKAFSAGSSPRDNQKPNPMAIATLDKAGVPTDGLTSKSWDVFATPDAPHMDLVITVCDNAAGEVCPYWPGQPATAHWGYPDPSETVGTDTEKAGSVQANIASNQKTSRNFHKPTFNKPQQDGFGKYSKRTG